MSYVAVATRWPYMPCDHVSDDDEEWLVAFIPGGHGYRLPPSPARETSSGWPEAISHRQLIPVRRTHACEEWCMMWLPLIAPALRRAGMPGSRAATRTTTSPRSYQGVQAYAGCLPKRPYLAPTAGRRMRTAELPVRPSCSASAGGMLKVTTYRCSPKSIGSIHV